MMSVEKILLSKLFPLNIRGTFPRNLSPVCFLKQHAYVTAAYTRIVELKQK
jgi:hypothetical protein